MVNSSIPTKVVMGRRGIAEEEAAIAEVRKRAAKELAACPQFPEGIFIFCLNKIAFESANLQWLETQESFVS